MTVFESLEVASKRIWPGDAALTGLEFVRTDTGPPESTNELGDGNRLADSLVRRVFQRQAATESITDGIRLWSRKSGVQFHVLGRVGKPRRSLWRAAYLRPPCFSKRTAMIISQGEYGIESLREMMLVSREILLETGLVDVVVFDKIRVPTAMQTVDFLSSDFLLWKSRPVFQMKLGDTAESESDDRDILAHLSKKRRYNLRRQVRLADEQGARFVSFAEIADPPECTRRLVELGQKTYQHEVAVTVSNSEGRAKQVEAGIRQGSTAGGFLVYDGRDVAYQICSLAGDEATLEEIGFDRSYERLSPGMVLLTIGLEDLRRTGVRSIDFGSGESQYKRVLGEHSATALSFVGFGRSRGGRAERTMFKVSRYADAVVQALRATEFGKMVRAGWRRRLAGQARTPADTGSDGES